MKRIICSTVVALSACVATFTSFSGCSTAPDSQAKKDTLVTDAQATLDRMKKSDHPGLQGLLDKGYGYAMIPEIAKGAVGVGGAYGRGVVYEGKRHIGYCDMSQATIGFQLGGQSYAEIIVFENKAALDSFTKGNFEFAAQASAVALKSGASANCKFDHGMAVLTSTNAGLMYEASIGGQKFSYKPL